MPASKPSIWLIPQLGIFVEQSLYAESSWWVEHFTVQDIWVHQIFDSGFLIWLFFEFILRKACGIEFVQKEVPGRVSMLSDIKFNLIYDTFYHLFQIIWYFQVWKCVKKKTESKGNSNLFSEPTLYLFSCLWKNSENSHVVKWLKLLYIDIVIIKNIKQKNLYFDFIKLEIGAVHL